MVVAVGDGPDVVGEDAVGPAVMLAECDGGGTEAEAFSRYIGLHLEAVNDGKTYSETSAAAREEGLPPDEAAELSAKADTLFKGETLRSILLNAYGWWTVATIALWAGVAMVLAGVLLGILAILGFRHASRAERPTQGTASPPPASVVDAEV